MGGVVAARRDRQVVRLLTLLRTLKEGGRPSIYELAARFHTRRETIYRDLRALQAIGYPIVGDTDGRLRDPSLAPEVRATIPPVLLTQQELAALVWATKQAGSRQPFRAGGTFEITRWILGWGDGAEVVRPLSLRREVAAIVRGAASLYRQRKGNA
jgi:predicted DNA-binding transcriptional regulator YafY